MGFGKHLEGLANAILKPFRIKTVRIDTTKPWDREFAKWIANAKVHGRDPNEVGDFVWNDDPLKDALERHYFPYVKPDSVVLELGPGTGRVTRHIISRCRKMILVDYSEMVCDWLGQYLKGKGRYKIYHIEKPSLPMVLTESVDMVFANGVFEHIVMDDLLCFLEEFHRVLKPGGIVAFNFDNIMSEEGMQWFKRWRGGPGTRCIFRFHHPEVVQRVAESVGFQTLQLTTSPSRFAYIELRKPDAQTTVQDTNIKENCSVRIHSALR